MKNIKNVAEFLKKAVRALRVRGKASVLKARLLFLASLRRRTAMVGGISHHIRALILGQEKAAAAAAAVDDRGKALALAEDVDEQLAPAGPHDVIGLSLSELARLFQEVDDDDGRGGGYPDWIHSLFDDDGINGDDDDNDERRVGEVVEEELEDEPSVIDVIRSQREGDGVEFNIEEVIDLAAEMFIRRVRRRRMNNRSF